MQMALAPGVELVPEPLAASEGEAEPRFRGSIRLRPPFPPLPPCALPSHSGHEKPKTETEPKKTENRTE
jgi:hypothetical protein